MKAKPVGGKPRTERQDKAEVDGESSGTSGIDTSDFTSLPHERDQSSDMTGGIPSARVKQGARDVKRGVQDTSRGVESDDAYRKLKKQ